MQRKKSAVPEREEPEEKVVAIVKKIKKPKGIDNISKEQRVKAVKPYCPEDLLNVYTREGATSRSYHFGEYSHPDKTNLQLRGYVDFYGGYAEHTRQVIDGLERTGKFAIRLMAIPAPRDLEPILANKMDWYMSNPAFHFKDSVFMTIAGPGHLRKDKLPDDDRYKIGWTMIETLDVQPDTVKWLGNVDEIYAPTQVDVAKFHRAGVKNVTWMPLGYDPNMWNINVPAMDIANVRNRYVFGYVGSWNVRKSVKEIVTAYITEFDSKEPVSLLMCTKYGTRKWGTEEMKEDEDRWCIKWELEQIIKELGIPREKVPHICIMDIPVHPSVLPTICARFDSLVGFSKGESTWLPGIEVGAMKKPIIQLASGCSGFMDYLYDNPYMCLDTEYKKADQELYEGTSEYYEGEQLAHGSVIELKCKMRRVYREQGTAQQKAIIENTYEKIEKYTWDRTINMLSDRLHKIV